MITHTGAPSRFLKGIELTLRWSTTEEQGLGIEANAEGNGTGGHTHIPLTAADAAGEHTGPVSQGPKDVEAGISISQSASTEANGTKPNGPPSPKNAELLAELARLKAENQRLKAAGKAVNRIRVSEKGGVSVYGLSRFPVTLYKEQWKRLLETEREIREFIRANDQRLTTK